MGSDLERPDPWQALSKHTPARVGLGTVGGAMRTRDVLAFDLACASARDAVRRPLDVTALIRQLTPHKCIEVKSQARDRSEYLRSPEKGRLLADESRARIENLGPDIALVIGDGLSSAAPQRHAAPLISRLFGLLPEYRFGPLVIAHQARVALADDVGSFMGARLSIILIGERPGLSSMESLGAYLTYAPQVGRKDSEKNCVSNIQGSGLTYDGAAGKLAWLVRQAFHRQLSGVGLTDDQAGTPPILASPPDRSVEES